MKTVISFFLVILLSFAACLYLPWWSVALAAFLVATLIHQKPLHSFIVGFTSVFLLWSALSFYISYMNNHILAGRMSLLILKNNSSYLLILTTGLIGGLVAGFAALTASFIYSKEKNK